MKLTWEFDSAQFPRLLAEIAAVGLTKQQFDQLCDSMDLEPLQVASLFERAEAEWESMKEALGEDTDVDYYTEDQTDAAAELFQAFVEEQPEKLPLLNEVSQRQLVHDFQKWLE